MWALWAFQLLAVQAAAHEGSLTNNSNTNHLGLLNHLFPFYEFDPCEYRPASAFLEMATLHHIRSDGWHSGEVAVHHLLKVPTRSTYPSATGLPPSLGYRVSVSPLVAIGAMDDTGRPWTTLWGAEPGFASPVAQNVIGLQSLIDRRHDPVSRALLGDKFDDGALVRPDEDKPRLLSGLSIDLETRDRVKLMGHMIVGALASRPGMTNNEESIGELGEIQLAMMVQESLGNCPKYLNKRAIVPHIPSPKLVSAGLGLPLPPEALALLEKASMFFLSSTNGQSMDTNHRGGPPGFMRVVHNSEADGVVLAYPEYSGNRLYQTLGNLHVNPKIGIIVPDYDTGDALYLTGETDLLVGSVAATFMPHAKVTVKIVVHKAIFVKDSLAFRGSPGELSPYNPPVRRLASEGALDGQSGTGAAALATLIHKEQLSSTIDRFTFRLRPEHGKVLRIWKPGQHVTFDFSGELDVGYSHMRENDPQSLNDDFIRTFTISNPPQLPHQDNGEEMVVDGTELQITVRQHGPASGFLRRQNLRAALELPVLGFGGEDSFRIPANDQTQESSVFIAGGVGITPLLAQAPGILRGLNDSEENRGRRLTLLWSLRAEDVPFAARGFEEIPGLAQRSKLFITGPRSESSGPWKGGVEKLKALGAAVEERRVAKPDVLEPELSGKRNKFYVCAGPELQRLIMEWLEHADVVSESFGY